MPRLAIERDFDPVRLALHKDPVRVIAEIMRVDAEVQCSERGVRLRHGEPITVEQVRVQDRFTGDDAILIKTVWVVD